MRRRTALTVGVFALAGCVARPEPTNEITSPPNFFADVTPSDDGYTVMFEYGTPLTKQNTERVSVNVRNSNSDNEQTWVSNDDPNAETTFPLEPGSSIDVSTPVDSTIDVIWFPPTEGESRKLDSFAPDHEGNVSADNESDDVEDNTNSGDNA